MAPAAAIPGKVLRVSMKPSLYQNRQKQEPKSLDSAKASQWLRVATSPTPPMGRTTPDWNNAARVSELFRARPERDDLGRGSRDLKTQDPVSRASTLHRVELPMSGSLQRQPAKIRRATGLQRGLGYIP